MFEDEELADPSEALDYPYYVEQAFTMVKSFRIEAEIEAFIIRWGGVDAETFVRVLKNGAGEDRLIALCALGLLAQPWTRELLLPFLHSPDHLARWASALLLGEMREEQAFTVLLKALTEFLPPANEELTVFTTELELHYIWHERVIEVLDKWQRPEVGEAFYQALIMLWNITLEQRIHSPILADICFHCQDDLAYALGRMHTLEFFKALPLPSFAVRLVMLQGICGYLDIRSRYSPSYRSTSFLLTFLRLYEASLGRRIMEAWEQHFGLSEQERAQFTEICSTAYDERELLKKRDGREDK